MELRTYRVVWEADIKADAPHDAAEKALALLRKPEAQETVFTVFMPERNDSVVVDAVLPGEN